MNWVAILLIIILSILAVYMFIPEVLFHFLGLGSWKRQYGPGVAITFDDGPNPDITPRILDILARHNVTATFFLVGERAAKHPDLVAKILEHQHLIGAHSQNHRHAWIMSPWAAWREWDESIATLERLVGRRVDWVRPPWGAFNLASWLWMKLHKKRIVLWNVEGHDWQAGQTPDDIVARLGRKVNEGSIILLHDAGGDTEAPVHTLQALDKICRVIVRERKLPIQKLEFPSWSIVRLLSFRVWEKWEHIFSRLYHLKRVDAINIFRLCRTRYKGPALYDRDGQVLAVKGDMVAEFHLDNIRLQSKSSNPSVIAVHALKQARASLPDIARFILNDPDYRNIKIFHGLTVIHQGIEGLGFQVQEVPPSLYNTLIGWLQGTVGLVYRPWDKTRKQAKKRTSTKLAWISRQDLINRWLPQDEKPESLT